MTIPLDGGHISSDADLTQASSATAQPKEQIGPYRLRQLIGEGGMGEVWLAEQTRPVHRQVALKVIKAGMDTAQVVARFEAERQALALMDHPAIARVFDAGATPEGRPYFVMEYVRGESITSYATRQKLSIPQRIELFMQVCEGVQHAHQKGIIHRDLKPSNILVTLQGDRPVPKIIDFGVAKAMTHSLTERTLHTELGALIGTPEYMSPEQAEMSGLDIDTRTDGYALGVVLYELLTGMLPFEAKSLREKGLDEIRRTIREVDPPKPSTKVTTSADGQSSGDAGRLASQLRGDLDWITMKALEKDRTRRYGSAAELAADLQRHLNHVPALASPPGTLYRARKFVRRHRVGVAAVTVLFVALVLGVTGTSIGLLRARRAEARARQDAATAAQVSDFLVKLFKVSDPSEARGSTITAREILDRGADQVRNELRSEPAVQATLMQTIGQVYGSLGLYKGGATLLEDALKRRETVLGPQHPDVAQTCMDLAAIYRLQGRYDATEPLLKRALAIREQQLGPHHSLVAMSVNRLAGLYVDVGRLDEAEAQFRRALTILDRPDGDREVLGRTLNNLSNLASYRNKYAEAETLLRRALAILEPILGADHPAIGTVYNNLAGTCENLHKFDESARLYTRAIEIRRRALGPDHPDVAATLDSLANLKKQEGNYERAESLYRESLTIDEKALGRDHPSVGRTLDNLGELLLRLHRYAEAETTLRRGFEIRERALQADHPELLASVHNLGALYYELKRPDQAQPLLRRALEARTKVLGADDVMTADSAFVLGKLLRDAGRPNDAVPLMAQAFETSLKKLGKTDSHRVEATKGYLDLLHLLGRTADYDAARVRIEAK